jgi:hypothetical protein
MGGQSSKSVFTGLVNILLEKDVDPNDHEFWDELWKTVLTVEEIFEVIHPDDVRKMVQNHPENIKTVFTQAVAQLYQVVETPYPIYFNQALNCARVLCRILPFLLESDSTSIRDLLWNKRLVKTITNEEENEDGSKAVESTEGISTQKAEGEGENTATTEGDQEEYQESEPLAVILINTIYHLLFLPEFTIDDPNSEFNEGDMDTPAFKNALIDFSVIFFMLVCQECVLLSFIFLYLYFIFIAALLRFSNG